jgi:hypothetical protein
MEHMTLPKLYMPELVDLLLAYGFAFGAMNKVDFLRKAPFFDKMLNCSYCTGFHAGWLMFLLSSAPSLSLMVNLPVYTAINSVLWGLASSAFCYLADTVSQTAERAWADKA